MRIKALGLLLSGLCCTSIQAATSDILMSRGGSTFAGNAGNVVFNGNQFVTPVVQSNGAIRLVFLDTNGVAVSNFSLAITGSSPRVALDGTDYLLAWLDSNATLLCTRLANGSAGTVSALATNVLAETLTLRAANGNFLAVWQSAVSNSAVIACWLAPNGSALGAPFAVAPSASPQRYPSLNNEGTNYLVCWMEQNTQSNDWHVAARFIDASGPLSTSLTVSETNSFGPHPTACSFGTNFLVAWSRDVHMVSNYDYRIGGTTDVWAQAVCGRMVSATGVNLGNAFTIARNIQWNTNVVISFGDDHFLAAWATAYYSNFQGQQRVQRLSADGSRQGYPIHTIRQGGFSNHPRVGFGHGRFCVLYPHDSSFSPEFTAAIVFGRDEMAEPALVNLRRTTNGGITVDNTSPTAAIEVSTNLVNWAPSLLTELPTLFGRARLFVRSFDHKWKCIEQMRALDWAKQQWAFEKKKVNSETPMEADLFGATPYLTDKPYCPHNGTYTLGSVHDKPNCTLTASGHTL